jgi:hypothetical protein
MYLEYLIYVMVYTKENKLTMKLVLKVTITPNLKLNINETAYQFDEHVCFPLL